MIILKFGGTSVKNAKAMANAAKIIQKRIADHPIVVISALAGITDLLIGSLEAAAEQDTGQVKTLCAQIEKRHYELIQELIQDKSIIKNLNELVDEEIGKLNTLLKAARTIRSKGGVLSHAVMSIGEILSSNILSGYLNDQHISTRYVDAREIMILEERRGEYTPDIALIQKNANKIIPSLFPNYQCVMCPGFIGSTVDGEPATLGRDGSDYTASLLGAVLEVNEIQIWSDVDGILSADPTIIPYAKPLKTMTFDEACELAYFGARVLHPSTIQPALEKGIPVSVLNSNNPGEKGTLIITNTEHDPFERTVKSIAYKEGITLLTVESSKLLLSPKLIEEIFLILTHHGKRVYAVSKSATKLSITIENHQDDLQQILNEIGEYGEVIAEKRKVIVSVVGEQMKGHPSVPWQILKLLDESKIKYDLVTQFANQISLMFIIDEREIEKAVKLLHKKFIEN